MGEIRHVVYSTSNCDYQAWQCHLLDASFQAAGQPGRLVRLCSEDPSQPERPFDGSTVARVLCLPSWTENEQTGDSWPIANKPASMELWLDGLPASADGDAILFLDPDMVFLEAVELDVEAGRVVAQRWLDPGVLDLAYWDRHAGAVRDRITATSIPMYPFAATVGDMRRIVPRFRELCHEIRDEDPLCWEADMYALSIAMHEDGLEIETLDELGVCTNWEERRDRLPAVIHYTTPIVDAHGTELWFKRNYTPSTLEFPWRRPPEPGRATNLLEQRLLEIVHAHIDGQHDALTREKADSA